MTNQPRIGSIKVCDPADYDGRILVEEFSYWGGQENPSWAVPAWEEHGHAALCGPFATLADAQKAMRAEFAN